MTQTLVQHLVMLFRDCRIPLPSHDSQEPAYTLLPGTSSHHVLPSHQKPGCTFLTRSPELSASGGAGYHSLSHHTLESKSLHSLPTPQSSQDKTYPSPGLEVSEEGHSGGFQGS